MSTAVSFSLFLFVFLIIGVLSVTKSKKTTDDYLVAGKSVPPWLAALSAVATNNSGYMFIGMIGLTYLTGLSSFWLMFGWILGDLSISLLAAKRIREISAAKDIHSYGGLLALWRGHHFALLRRLSGILILFFLTLYAAAQLKAGSKALYVLLDWPAETGVIIGAIIVLAYSVAGGIRASIWTDAAQSFLMIGGMAALLILGLIEAGGWGRLTQTLQGVQPGFMNWFASESAFHNFLFVTGWLFAGAAVIGQPHIVIRYMTLDSANNINKMRAYYYGWFTLFYGMTVLVGLLCRALFVETQGFDAELALPRLARSLFSPFFQGAILASLFAATMSTADSLILSCSAAFSRDLIQRPNHSLLATKLSTVLVLVVATLFALYGDKNVFSLVLDAWGLLGSAFTALIVAYCLNWKINEPAAILSVCFGVGAFLFWNQIPAGKNLYAVAPGILTAFLPLVFRRLTARA